MVVVIATLMGLVFRLAGVGGGQAARNKTITRMQKLEFALSGYYAAFGSYPPVPLHGSRDIFCNVDSHGIQVPSGENAGGGNETSKLNWPQVRAACLCQPVACEYPYNTKSEKTKYFLELQLEEYSASFGKADMEPNPSSLQNANSADWTKVQVFKFGVLSFLLPRYLFMLQGEEDLYKEGGSKSAQWRSQNDIRQLLDFETGAPVSTSWEKVQENTGQRQNNDDNQNYKSGSKYLAIARQSSQSVCARWIHALDGILYGGQTFFGVNTRMSHADHNSYFQREGDLDSHEKWEMLLPFYSASGSHSGSGGNYVLDGMTVRDGWGNDLFYYSDPPYQGYQLWSAGPNRKTVPPWIELNMLDASNRKTAAEWLADDIVGLSTAAN